MLLILLSGQVVDPSSSSRLLDLTLPSPSCAAANASADVTVCGRRDRDRYRIPPQYRAPPVEGLGRAERRIGNVGVSADTQRVDVGGWPSNRIMLTIKIPI